jgi:hypothetical protein
MYWILLRNFDFLNFFDNALFPPINTGIINSNPNHESSIEKILPNTQPIELFT